MVASTSPLPEKPGVYVFQDKFSSNSLEWAKGECRGVLEGRLLFSDYKEFVVGKVRRTLCNANYTDTAYHSMPVRNILPERSQTSKIFQVQHRHPLCTLDKPHRSPLLLGLKRKF